MSDSTAGTCVVKIGATQSKSPQAPVKAPASETGAPNEDPAMAGAAPATMDVDLLPVQAATLVAAADMYALEPKPASVAGGLLTVLAVLAALAYTVYQLVDYSRIPPTVTADVQWADTQGPFAATIRCTAPGGCWVSNRHNDKWSSNGDQVEAAQQGCLVLAPGEEHVMNITFTQNVRNGLVVVWDPSQWDPSTTPGSGFQVLAETNSPSSPSGIAVLATPALGGTYLANHVETHNNSAPVAKLRKEWFITYVSADKNVIPATTACADQLSAAQVANYTQATIRIQAAWYKVTIDPPDLWVTLIGNCGGALQLFLQGGAILLLTWEISREKMRGVWARLCCSCFGGKARGRQVTDHAHDPAAGASAAGGHARLHKSLDYIAGQAYSLTGQVFVDEKTGRHFALMSPGGLQSPGAAHHAHTHGAAAASHASPHEGRSALMRGLAAMSLSGDGGVGTALRGLPVGGHRSPAAGHHSWLHNQQQQPRHGGHVLFLSSSGGGT